LALWRMDSFMMALIAREDARPPAHYQAFYAVTPWLSSRGDSVRIPSPLLSVDAPLVYVHFQVGPDGGLTSPQIPADPDWVHAISLTGTDRINRFRDHLDNLANHVGVDTIRAAAADLPAYASIDLQRTASGTVTNFYGPAQTNQSTDDQPVPQKQARSRNAAKWQQEYNQQQLAQRQAARDSYAALSKLSHRPRPSTNRDEDNQQASKAAEDGAPTRSQRLAASSAPPEAPATDAPPAPLEIKESELTPRWVDNRLLLLRRVQTDGPTRIQGAWIDWSGLRSQLTDQVSDLLPDARLEPLTDGQETPHQLASAPIQLIPAPFQAVAEPLSAPVRNGLIFTWVAVLLAIAAVGWVVRIALNLSERRGAFVSAVTHELRTPLTTFRMYAQMLDEGRVRNEDDQAEYFSILRREADRLGHLVENVLAYARLEKVGTENRRQTTTVGELIDRTTSRLHQRVDETSGRLTIQLPESLAGQRVTTDVSAVGQVLFNLVDNACKYGHDADQPPEIDLHVECDSDRVRIIVTDHGPGVTTEMRGRIFRPFAKSAAAAADSEPGVGLGLSLSRRLARGLGGRLDIEAHDGSGARFVLTLPTSAD
ncbi:MAG: HAMP domain-containing sensor histidine kinase, partial [Phycisphaeraceae bacterium]|nr:HAMP domain-containing sensor histidine kinase [Phycisphaeraceae bacterium]